jgi:hypothetical protein
MPPSKQHTVDTLTTPCIKTHHITASDITPHRLNNLTPKFLTIVHFKLYFITFIILAEIIIFIVMEWLWQG